MKNKIVDLKNHLYAQLERLGDEDLTKDELDMEIKRSKAITDVSKNLVEIFETEVELTEIALENGYEVPRDKLFLSYDSEKNK